MARPRINNRHLPKYITVINGSYWYRPPKAKPMRVARVGEEKALYDFIAVRMAPTGPLISIGDCLDRYEREILPALAAKTQKEYRRSLGVLRDFCGHLRPDELLTRHVGKFLDVSEGKIARNRHVAVLSAVYSKMVGRWYVAERNPCVGVERHKAKPRNRYVTDAEYQAIYGIATPRVQIAMEIALETGQRQWDVLNLKWDAVLEEGIRFQQHKTGKRRLVAKSIRMEAAIKRAKALLPHLPREYVIRSRNGQPYSSDGFRAIWSRYIRKAVEKRLIKEPFTFHDLRRKSGSDSSTLQEAQERLGHSDPRLTSRIYDCGERTVTPLSAVANPSRKSRKTSK